MLATVTRIWAGYAPQAHTYAVGCNVRCSVVDRKRILRTSPFGHSRKFAKKFQISLIWGMLRSTQLSMVSSAYASKGLEPCSVAGGHLGPGEPVVQPAAARARRRLRL